MFNRVKIGLNHTSTIGIGGNATYARELIQNLAKIDKKNQYYLYYYIHDFLRGKIPSDVDNRNFKPKPAYFTRWKFPISLNFIRFVDKISLGAFTKFNKIDIFHFTDPLTFVSGPYKSIITLHDLAVLHNPDWAKKVSLDFYKKNIKNVLNQVDKIITDAEFTKKDIIKFFNIDAEKIKPIHLAAENIFHPNLDKRYLKEKFGLKEYILNVGELQPRKNIIRLLEAYSKLDIKLRQDYNLVLAGKARDDNFANRVSKAIKNFNIKEQVRQLGFIEDNDLSKLYGGARFLVYPSLFEGFGLPVLQSISCGIPVITSNVSSLPEVAGQAGILVDPEDVSQIKSAMEKLLLDEQLYQDLKSKCLKQASKFSWQKTARKTLAVYEEVYGK